MPRRSGSAITGIPSCSRASLGASRAPLSAGRCVFTGMITCAYHGWTYDLASGDLVAALTDGPDSPICGKASVRVRTYPVEERAGLIWVWPGDEPPPPV